MPYLLPDFAALLARIDSEASVWKKWPGSVDRDISYVYLYDVVDFRLGIFLRQPCLLALRGVRLKCGGSRSSWSGVRVEWKQKRDALASSRSNNFQVLSSWTTSPILRTLHTLYHGDDYTSSHARQTCPYERSNLSVIYSRWHEIDHGWIQQHNARVQDWI